MELIKKGYLDRDTHKLYFELCGKEGGEPWIYLHGGPGSYFKDNVKEFFEGDKKVLFFNQRGSPNNKYEDILTDNNTDFLIDDIVCFMKEFGFEKVNIFGSSWGSTLALLFAIKYPDKCLRLVLNGVFLGTKSELKRVYDGSLKEFYPEVWDYVNSKMVVDEKLFEKVFEGLKGDNKLFYYKMFFLLESMSYKLDNNFEEVLSYLDTIVWNDSFLLAPHYFKNYFFLEDNFILNNTDKITCKVDIVNARQDMTCPLINAYTLHKKLKDSSLNISFGGHSKYDGNTASVLKEIINK